LTYETLTGSKVRNSARKSVRILIIILSAKIVPLKDKDAIGNQFAKESYLCTYESIGYQLTGDVLFSCLGTTIKAAGSQQAQWKVDYTYQYEAALSACS